MPHDETVKLAGQCLSIEVLQAPGPPTLAATPSVGSDPRSSATEVKASAPDLVAAACSASGDIETAKSAEGETLVISSEAIPTGGQCLPSTTASGDATVGVEEPLPFADARESGLEVSFDWVKESDVVLCHCTAFDDRLMRGLERRAEGMRFGAVIVTVTRKLTSPLFELLRSRPVKTNHGEATAHIFRRKRMGKWLAGVLRRPV